MFVHLPILLPVGVGGLEPPTSASQTRRAGRLRYTPADKSIIRSMDKRQDTLHIRYKTAAWLTLSLILVLILTGCQTDLNPMPPQQIPLSSTPITNPPDTPPAPTITPTQPMPTVTPGIDCLQAGGNVHRGSFLSHHLGEDLHYQVYLPPCYHDDIEITYPVLYLLHGLSYNQDQWLRLGVAEQMDRLIADGSIAPFIIIMPGEARFQPPQISAYADALVKELVPWVDQQYRTQPEKSTRAIGGLSRGAAWAVHIGFEYHHLFSSVGAHSLPLFEIDGGRLTTWLLQTPGEDLPRYFIDIGRSDPERSSAQDFADQLNAYHIPHTWYLFNGGHTEAYWSGHLELYLRWYARDWSIR